MKNVLLRCIVAACAVLGSATASAGISYTCDPTIDAAFAGTCATLNSSIAALYGNTFTNANASIYIRYGTTDLGSNSTGSLNLVTYSAYRAALVNTANDATDTAALASLPSVEPALYGGGQIQVTSALGRALGLTGLTGVTSTGGTCANPGSSGCYNGVITIEDPIDLFASTGGNSFNYRTGPISPSAYDFYSVVEHQTDDVLGIASCVDTSGASLADGCGGSNAAAVDLFRYNGGSRVFIDTTAGADFSFDGGATSVATLNTLSNGEGYADFITNCEHVQDAAACLGQSFDITSDGGAELSILDSLGYNLVESQQTLPAPEPESMALFGLGLMTLWVARRKVIR